MKESTKYGLLLILVNICFFCAYYFLFGLKRTNNGCVNNNHVLNAIKESKDNKSKENIFIGKDSSIPKISGFNYISVHQKD